jgi:prepilin-type N-terminal cleavage/methylation domain-containing protein
MGRRAKVDRRGFTLLELLVTLLVLALALGVTMPSIGRGIEAVRARADVARFSAMLRHAREQAITTRRPHAVVVDPAAHRLLLLGGDDEVRETRALRADLTVEPNPPNAFRVSFQPHGVSSGGSFRLVTGGMRYRVSVDALTGRVRADRE